MSSLYTPRISAIVPPETPGIRSAVPMAIPLKNRTTFCLEVKFFNNQNFTQYIAKNRIKRLMPNGLNLDQFWKQMIDVSWDLDLIFDFVKNLKSFSCIPQSVLTSC